MNNTFIFRLSLCIATFLLAASCYAETITKPYTFTDGTPAMADEVNANFDTLYNQVNTISDGIKVVYLKDVQPSGVHGGTCTAGSWLTRTLNTLSGNGTFVTLADNSFTLTEGTYDFYASAPAFVTAGHKTKLRNITADTDELIGGIAFSNNSYPTETYSSIRGVLVVNAPTTFQVQHRCQVSSPTAGFGYANSFGVDEIYTQVKITKLK